MNTSKTVNAARAVAHAGGQHSCGVTGDGAVVEGLGFTGMVAGTGRSSDPHVSCLGCLEGSHDRVPSR
jgi:hypothetical protein